MILVIEDDPTIRANIQDILDAEGFEGLFCATGTEGVACARSVHPDLVLCDVGLPGMDGYGVLRALRADPDTAEIPLIFLSARADPADVKAARAMGAADYVVKPFTLRGLLGAITAKLKPTEAPARVTGPPSRPGLTPGAMTPGGSSVGSLRKRYTSGGRTEVDGRFQVVSYAGSGGMATVFKAVDTRENQVVALKILHDHAPAHHHTRFAREVAILAELSHPAVVRYIAHGTTEDQEPYLAMEWLEGEDLGVRLTRGRLTIPESVTLALTMAGALEAAHTRGVLHRDVKPTNVFLCGPSMADARLLDFGVARLSSAMRATRTGSTLGTPGYMAPEQASGSENIDARADVYALGCVLFECLTGRQPFVAENAIALTMKSLLEDAPRVRTLRPEVPVALDAFTARMLGRTPDQRPETCAAVVAGLSTIQGTLTDP